MNLNFRNIIIAGVMLTPVLSFSQEDTSKVKTAGAEMLEKHINEVVVGIVIPVAHYSNVRETKLNQRGIELLAADDVGELLTKASGSSVKSYGGLGGLKSVSVQGLGGEHNVVIQDGFAISNARSGQLNLGQLQSDGVTTVSVIIGPSIESLAPVSAELKGSMIDFQSFMLEDYGDEPRVEAKFRYGSFDRVDAFVRGEKSVNKWHFAGFGKYRQADGDYKFSFLNGTTEVRGLRGNNDYKDLFAGAKVGYRLGNGNQWQIQYRESHIDQGLPGAVIFYNESADERMKSDDFTLLSDFRYKRPGAKGRVYATGNLNKLGYFDPTYLNEAGFLDQKYRNSSVSAGAVEIIARWKYGIEQMVDLMTSNREDLGRPIRSSTYGMVQRRFAVRRLDLDMMLGGQYVYDQNANQEVNNQFQFTPAISIGKTGNRDRFVWSALYKRTFRMPSFNELYFGSVGNTNLKPEIAHKGNIGYQYFFKIKRFKMHCYFTQDAFFNEVQNKIVAIPTKNLFVWSMQNVGQARVFGSNGDLSMYRLFGKKLNTRLALNYTWQKVIDVTEGSVTRGDQLAYVPEHLGNADLILWRDHLQGRISNNFVSGRYALNQNVPENYLEGYWTMDVSLGYKRKLKNQDYMGIQVNAKNIWNNSYAFIRSYVMPGRHFLITLNYEIH